VHDTATTAFAIQKQNITDTMNVKSINDYPDLLTVAEVMEILRLGRRSVYQLIKDGTLAARKMAGNTASPREISRKLLVHLIRKCAIIVPRELRCTPLVKEYKHEYSTNRTATTNPGYQGVLNQAEKEPIFPGSPDVHRRRRS
jgi:excisionase family DNA binding protein